MKSLENESMSRYEHTDAKIKKSELKRRSYELNKISYSKIID